MRQRGLVRVLVVIAVWAVAAGFSATAYAVGPMAIQSGETASGSISSVDATDSYTFAGTVGDRILVDAVTTDGDLNTTIDLVAPSGLVEQRSYSSDQLSCALKESGAYEVVVSDYSLGHTGDYNVALQQIPGATSSAGDPDGGALASGETTTAAVAATAEMDAFTFSGTTGDRVMANAVATSGLLNTTLVLISPTGVVEELTYGGDQLTSLLRESGTYTVVISDYSLLRTGSYALTLLTMPGATSSAGDLDGGVIVSGETTGGGIDTATDMDAFKFEGTTGDRVVAHAVATSGLLDTTVYLVSPTGVIEQLTYGQDEVSTALRETGTYTLVIADEFLTRTGEYNITFHEIPGATSSASDPDGGAIVSGETTSGTIGVASDIDVFTFTGTTGERVLANIVTRSGQLNTTFYLVSPTGSIEEMGYGSDQLGAVLRESGTYSIVLWDYAYTHTGEYNVTMQQMPGVTFSGADPDGGAIESGQTTSATVNAVSDMDAFTFTGTAGDRVLVNAVTVSGQLNTDLELVSPSGVVEEVSYGLDELSAALRESGTYTVLVYDAFLMQTGKYNLTLQTVPGTLGSPEDPDGSAIVSGQTVVGSIGVASDMDAYTFVGDEDDRVTLDAVATSGQLNTTMALVSPTGAVEELTYGADQLIVDLQESGTYSVVVMDYTLTHAGGYTLSLVRNPATIVTTSHSAAVSQGAVYNLTGTLAVGTVPLAGQQVVLETSADGVTFSATPVLATSAADGRFTLSARPIANGWLRARFAGTAKNGPAEGTAVEVAVRAWVGPPTLPRKLSRKKSYTLYGYIKPRHAVGTWVVRIYTEYYSNKRWRPGGYVLAKASDYSAYTKYSRRLRFSAGKWRVRAFHSDGGHVDSWSGYKYFTSK